MKIAFFGTSDKSVPILEALSKNFDLALCVTKEDTVVGRKKEIRQTEVKKWAKERNVPYMTITSLKGADLHKVLEGLQKHNVALGIVADFNFIIPKDIIGQTRLGLINVHFSLLPKYRGASPVQHSILNGEGATGITFQLIDTGMDTGDILCQVGHDLKNTETTGTLYKELFELASQKIINVIDEYVAGQSTPVKQDNDKATYCYSVTHPKSTYIYKEDTKINWEDAAEINERKIRAYNPWPIAWTTLGDLQSGKIVKLKKHVLNMTNYENMKLKIHKATAENDKFIPLKVQLEGKNITDWKSFLNGYAENESLA